MKCFWGNPKDLHSYIYLVTNKIYVHNAGTFAHLILSVPLSLDDPYSSSLDRTSKYYLYYCEYIVASSCHNS
jgi:hypothetical protein